jgi:hypothetical protein
MAASKLFESASPYFALLSSVCIAVIGFTNPQRRANGYVAAWRIVGTGLLRYEAGESTLADLISAIERGEAHIGEIDSTDTNKFRRHLPEEKTRNGI